jgi:asparagine synthase (glutamine-hydrolysing)
LCGIVGANFNFDYNNSLSHRGPDAFGTYKDNYINLYHHRLSIIDSDKRANQPFLFKDYILVFNGEIYNYLELKKELKEYNFKTSSDTEVLLYLYDKWGKNCVNKFNGDFSFCIYNKKTKKIFCARDRIGNKPFYYYFKDNKFVFASEIKALKNFINDFNHQKLGDSILFSINDNDEYTIYKDIYNLKPAHYLEFNLLTCKLKISNYWKIEAKIKNKSLSHFLEKFEDILKNAVEIRLRSDEKIGAMLSGGIDSSLISYFLKDKNIQFYTISHPNDKTIDETNYVKLLEKKFNLNVKYLTPTFDDLKKDVDDLIKTQDDIFRSFSIYMQYYLFKNANVKVMLSGQGADELFGGYYYHIARIIANNKKEFRNRIKIYKNKALDELKLGIKFNLENGLKLKLLKEDNKENLEKVLFYLEKYRPNWDLLMKKFEHNIKKTLINDTISLNLPMLLRYEDRNAMRFSIENRTPFTDYRVIEFAHNIPVKYKFKNGLSKYFLREFAKNKLPKKIVYRIDKKGFEAPDKFWMKKLNMTNLVDLRLFIFNKLKEIYV